MNSDFQPVSNKTNSKKGDLVKATIATFFVVPALLFWITIIVIGLGIFAIAYKDTDSCNVARIPIQGILTATDNGLNILMGFGQITSADSIIDKLYDADDDDTIRAILIDIDSPGGTPVAADEILSALESLEKPVVAVIRDRGISAAYWVAVGADHIIASPVSDVGSIGVTMSYLELASTTENQGSRWINISSGEYKDAGHPERVLSEKEREHFQGQVDDVHEYMIERISSARDTLSREEVDTLADGRAYLGTEALKLKLIDELGGFVEASTYIKNRLSSEDDLILCPLSSRLGSFL